MLVAMLTLLCAIAGPTRGQVASRVDLSAGAVELPNPSFEAEPSDQGAWSAGSEGGQLQTSWDQTVAHSGSASLRVGHSGPGWGGWFQRPARSTRVAPGRLVEARVWARTDSATGRTYISLDWHSGDSMVGQSNGGSPFGSIIWRLNPIGGDNDWTPLYARAIAPEGCDRVRIGLRSEGNSGWAWFDDAQLRIVPEDEMLGELSRHPTVRDPRSLRPDDYVTARGGHLWHGNRRFRAWGAQGNLLGLTHADTDLEVVRFKEHGFNAFRTLWWAEEVTDEYAPGDLSPQDRKDYLLACLGRHGVSVWSDILNSCQIRPDHVDAIDLPASADAWRKAVEEWVGDKGYALIRQALPAAWDPRIQRVYHDYIRRVLAHRNRYNGLTYAEDPTFFTWELTNEEWWLMRILWGNHLELPAFFQRELYAKWTEWLRAQYGDTASLAGAWSELLQGETLEDGSVLLLPLLGKTEAAPVAEVLGLQVSFQQTEYGPGDFSAARAADVIRFLTELHLDYKRAAAAVFKAQGRRGIGCQSVPLVFDTGYSGAVLPLYMQSFGDATACGSYIDQSTHDPGHPTFPFTSGLTSPPSINDWLDSRRVAGKPAFVYENMLFNPQKYRAEYPYRLVAWAATQDMDVIDFHYYGHPLPFPGAEGGYSAHILQYMPSSGQAVFNGCVMRPDEVLMTATRAAGEIFKRGYLRPAPAPATVALGSDSMWRPQGINGGQWAKAAQATALRRGFRWAFTPQRKADLVRGRLADPSAPAPPVIRPSSQIAYRWQEGLMVIDDPRAKVLAGFVPRRFEFSDELKLRRIRVQTPEGMPFVVPGERYVAFAAVSQDGLPLANSRRILISATNTSWNSGFRLDLEHMAGDTAYAAGLARSITNHGDLPVLVGRVGLQLRADWLTGRTYEMVDYNGHVLSRGVLDQPRLAIPSELPVYATIVTMPRAGGPS